MCFCPILKESHRLIFQREQSNWEEIILAIDNIGNKCCGCRTCLQKCKSNAITFVTDIYGFEYPKIDSELCTSCGLCEKVCPITNTIQLSYASLCGMAYALDAQTRFNGASGGLFGVFAESVLAQDGIVFGAAFDENLKLKTTKAETLEELLPLYKSKYLLCDTSFQFDAIENELNRGRMVLYCSSPCQISALKLYLGKEYDNLLTIDFVCHGVGSQKLFDKSIEYTQEKDAIEIKKVVLRYKKANASSSYYYNYYYSKNGEFHEQSDLYLSFPFYNAYCKQLACRDSCYDCKFATRGRIGDITIGDFHSIRKYYPDIDRFAGVSMFLVNTPKGRKWFEIVKEKIYWQEMEKEIIYKNNRFSDEVIVPTEQPAFRDSIATESFEITVKKFLRPSRDWIKLIYYKAPKWLRNIVIKFR